MDDGGKRRWLNDVLPLVSVSSLSSAALYTLADLTPVRALVASLEAALAIGGLYQAQRHHSESIGVENRHHQESLSQEKNFFDKELQIERQQHLHNVTTDLREHQRQADRELWEQRTEHLQTMMMVSALMFDAGLTVIVQGTLPADAGEDSSLPFYFGVLSLGLALHFLAIVSAIALQERMSSFMVERTVGQQETLKSLRATLNKFLDHMKGAEKSEVRHGVDDEYKLRTKLADKLREQILVRIRGSTTSCASFDSWFLIHCARIYEWINWFFKIGTVSLLVGLSLYVRLKVKELEGGMSAPEMSPADWAFHSVLLVALVLWACVEYSQRRYSRIIGRKRMLYEKTHDEEISEATVGGRILEIEKAIKQVAIARSLRELILSHTDLDSDDDLKTHFEMDCRKQEAEARKQANAVAQTVEDFLSRALRFTDGPRARQLMRANGSLRSLQHVKYWLDKAEKLELGDGKCKHDASLVELYRLEQFAKEVREQRYPVILERVRLHDSYQKARKRLQSRPEHIIKEEAVSRLRVDEFHLVDTARTLFEELDVDGSKTISLVELLVALGVERIPTNVVMPAPPLSPRNDHDRLNRYPSGDDVQVGEEAADELFFRQQSVDRVHALLRVNEDLAGALVAMFVTRVDRKTAHSVRKAITRIKLDPDGAREQAHLAVERYCKNALLPTLARSGSEVLDEAEVGYEEFLQHIRDTFM